MLRNIKTLGTSKSIKSSKLPSIPRRRNPRKEIIIPHNICHIFFLGLNNALIFDQPKMNKLIYTYIQGNLNLEL
jgi:hypothetical protein